MSEFNPYEQEATHTNEEMAAEIRSQLETLKRQKEYLEQMLALYDPAELRRQQFIDDFYRGE